MQRPVQITFKDIPHSDAVETHIREKAAKLETFYPHIIGCHVTVELPLSRSKKVTDRPFSVFVY